MAMLLHPPKRRRSSAPPPVVATSNDGVLPLDLLYDVLLRLPAETLCRFRAVCRSWRSLLSHADFIAAARNPGPLIAVGIKDYLSKNEVTVLDMESGGAVTRVKVANNDLTYPMSHDRVVCILDPQNRLRLFDPANGDVVLLPDHAPREGHILIWSPVGRAASTREHKVLAITTSTSARHEPFVCKILTLGLGDDGWRVTQSPSLMLVGDVAVINGVAYFLSSYAYHQTMVYQQIMAFDFNKEVWRSSADSLRGPANCQCIKLAELEGQLVACQSTNRLTSSIELWFLMDSDRSLWFKRYTINMPAYQTQTHQPQMCYTAEFFQKPLAVLDDGRIVIYMRQQGCIFKKGILRIYNPRTKTFKDGTLVPHCNHMSLFTWNLLDAGQKGALDDAVKRLLIGRRHH
ncbi:unnamed protein product [Triticum turgidum subsp. durum]|uniref:F-box domain-containing protein n=1 Tax=Triticum turgidum subsp. durum TaxID=4567 RepID=A0A9R1AU42_TRITD|nr:unnamed protein product [Triticum turgidum subsp. durum]